MKVVGGMMETDLGVRLWRDGKWGPSLVVIERKHEGVKHPGRTQESGHPLAPGATERGRKRAADTADRCKKDH